MRIGLRGLAGFVAAVLGGTACGGAGDHGASSAGAVPMVGGVAAKTYRLADGSVDYTSLRADFGEPNQNLTLNPRAVDVSKTPSVHSVQNLPGRLVFARSDANWLLARQPGDVLYCNQLCGGHGFLRKIVSITPSGDTVVVEVTNAALTDLLWNGWLHAEIPLPDEDPRTLPSGGTTAPPSMGNGLPAPREDEGSKPESTEPSGDESETHFKGKVSGHIYFEPTFHHNIVIDIVHRQGIHWDQKCDPWWPHVCVSVPVPYVEVDLVKFVLQGTPELTFGVGVTAKEAYEVPLPNDGHIWGPAENLEQESLPPEEVSLGDIQVGPVPVIPNLEFRGDVGIEVEGKISATIKASVSDSFTTGFIWTPADGFQGVNQSTFTPPSPQFKGTGEAGMEAYGKTSLDISFMVFDLAGPVIGLEWKAGAEIKVEDSASIDPLSSDPKLKCEAGLYGDFFSKLKAHAGGEISLFGLWAQKWDPVDMVLNQFTVPAEPGYKLPGSDFLDQTLCPEEPDAGTEDAGSPNLDGGEQLDGGGGACGSQTCGAGQCRSNANPGSCTSDPGEALGCGCQSDSDCNCGQSNSYAICFQGTCTQGCKTDGDCPSNQSCIQPGTSSTYGSCPAGGPGCCY